jgi:hypothetical protein
MKKTKISKKQFEENEYRTDDNQMDTFRSLLKRSAICRDNYEMVTINCPNRIKESKNQLRYLNRFLSKLTVKYVGCMEWSDERANGYHLHLIVSKIDSQYHTFSKRNCHISQFNACHTLERCMRYVCKERRNLVTKEKQYFTNIEGRNLIPIAPQKPNSLEIPWKKSKKANQGISIGEIPRISIMSSVMVVFHSVKKILSRMLMSGSYISRPFFQRNNIPKSIGCDP